MISTYPLHDSDLIESCLLKAAEGDFPATGENHYSAFIPKATYVSLGASNSIETHVIIENCITDNVLLFKRLSGGEAVYLSPNCVVFSHILISDDLPKSATFFLQNLDRITACLQAFGISNVLARGISDLAIGDKKILGSAIYRRQRVILFQAVLNVCESPWTIERYLKHPPREPDYRHNRPHSDFITSLQKEGYMINSEDIIQKCYSS